MNRRVMTVSELVRRIKENGAFHFPNSHIVGEKPGNVTLNLMGCSIEWLCLSDSWFRGTLRIKGGRIGKLSLDNATVTGKLYISSVTINMRDVDTRKLMVDGKPFMQTAFPREGRNAGQEVATASA